MQIKDDFQGLDSSLGLSLSCRSSVNSVTNNRRLDDAAAASSSSSSFYRQSHHPLQLELLPLRPSSSSGTRANVIPAPTATAAAATASLFWQPQLPVQHRAVVLDMNLVPEINDGGEINGGSRGAVSESTTTSLVMKRERERERSSEERTCEVSSRGSDEDGEGAMSGSRKKLRLTKEQSTMLEESFKEHSTLNPKQKAELARQLNLRPRQVEVWFQNRRARTKLKQTEVDCELLKRCCESLTEENRRLQKEVQELRALKVAPPCLISHDRFMPLPAATLTMCPSCERLATHPPPDAASGASAATISAPIPLSFIPRPPLPTQVLRLLDRRLPLCLSSSTTTAFLSPSHHLCPLQPVNLG